MRLKNIRLPRSAFSIAAAASIAATPLYAQDATPQYGGELIYAQSGEKFSLFPGRNTDNGAQDIWLNACENLFEINEDRELVPVLAESWDVSEDEKTVTIKLREGVTFHAGTPFNGEAVAFVFNEAKEKEFIYMSLLEGFDHADAPSEYEVAFHREKPFAALLPNLAYKPLCIFSPTAYKEMGEEGMGGIIGNDRAAVRVPVLQHIDQPRTIQMQAAVFRQFQHRHQNRAQPFQHMVILFRPENPVIRQPPVMHMGAHFKGIGGGVAADKGIAIHGRAPCCSLL